MEMIVKDTLKRWRMKLIYLKITYLNLIFTGDFLLEKS